MANLTKQQRKEKFKKLIKKWDKPVEMWHVRAFVYGSMGLCELGKRERK